MMMMMIMHNVNGDDDSNIDHDDYHDEDDYYDDVTVIMVKLIAIIRVMMIMI